MMFMFSFVSCSDQSSTLSGENKSTESTEDEICLDFQYRIQDDYAVIMRYIGNKTDVVIPEKLDNYPVKVIESESFYQHVNIEKVTIPESIEKIGSSAFYRCYSLKGIFIPKNVKVIEGNPFFRCSSLEYIYVDENNENYTDNDGVLYSKDMTDLRVYPEGKVEGCYIIPDSVRKICEDAFGYKTQSKIIFFPINLTDFPEFNYFIYPDSIVFLVYENSKAEEYAKNYGIKYIYVH